jgi:hypothetical protein
MGSEISPLEVSARQGFPLSEYCEQGYQYLSKHNCISHLHVFIFQNIDLSSGYCCRTGVEISIVITINVPVL